MLPFRNTFFNYGLSKADMNFNTIHNLIDEVPLEFISFNLYLENKTKNEVYEIDLKQKGLNPYQGLVQYPKRT